MLLSLRIKNLYLIDELNLDFGDGLNVLTGETGAGKSIILGTIGLIIGDKSSSDIVRTGYKQGYVEAIFDISNIPEIYIILEKKGLPIDDDNLIIKRVVSADGKSKAFINMSFTTVAVLKEIGEYLVDISSQNQHQHLLKQVNHLSFLDNYSKLANIILEFKQLWNDYLSKKEKLTVLLEKEKEKEKLIEFSKFAINEIEAANLVDGEEVDLENELKMLKNYQKLMEVTEECYKRLYGSSNSIITYTEIVINELNKIVSFNSEVSDVINETNEALYKLEFVKDFVRNFRDSLEFSPERIDQVNERLNDIKTITTKYGGSVQSAIEYKDECINTLQEIQENETEIKEIKKELEKMETIISEKALFLSRKRITHSKELEKKVEEELSYLNMQRISFKVEFKYIEDQNSFLKIKNKGIKIDENGIDKVEFMIANLGEEPKALAKSASGGELSRIMLAIKSILISSYSVGTVIFDEVDVGIGGETSNKVGDKIKALAKKKRVLCITHSPQIASKGDCNYLVEKNIKDGRTITNVQKLDDAVKIKEIARMLGGDNITDLSLMHATELIKNN